MSDTRDGKRSGDGKADGGTIIDAKVEPLRKLNWTPRHTRIALLLGAAIVISIAVAVVIQLGSTGRLDLAALTGQAPAQNPPASVAPPPAPAHPGAIVAQPPAPAAAAALAKRIDDLDKRLAALTDGLDRLQQVGPEQAAARVSPQQLSDLATGLQGQMQSLLQARLQDEDKRLAALETAVAGLQSAKDEQAAGRIVMQQRMDEFDARLNAAVQNRAAALRAPVQQLLAWSELRDRARRGLPFAAQMAPLTALAEKAGGDAGQPLRDAVAALQPFADAGAPTQLDLLAGFPAAAEKQAAAFRAPDATATARPWWQRAFDKVAGLVSIRRVDAATDAGTPEGKLAAAGDALHGGDLAGAGRALDGMTLVPALADWRRQAAARLALDAALEQAAGALQAYFAAP
jgi:hypothetical protein